jgi:hypothetical protein
VESSDSQEQPEDENSKLSPIEEERVPLSEQFEETALEIARKVITEEFLKRNSGGVTLTIGEIQGGLQLGDYYSQTNDIRKIFIDSVRKRDDFMSTFLNQALRQAGIAFNLSIAFMVLGGLIVLTAAILAIGKFAGSPSHGIALVSGAGGLLIGTSGAAFSRRSDKARKHLAEQAAMMQSQFVTEQKFSQVVDLLTGIRDDKLNDQARMTLAARIMDELNKSSGASLNASAAESKERRRRQRDNRSDLFGCTPLRACLDKLDFKLVGFVVCLGPFQASLYHLAIVKVGDRQIDDRRSLASIKRVHYSI